ncbi:MAG: hypothetical protein EX271_07060, partial [Acidimicrobiales bacterium]
MIERLKASKALILTCTIAGTVLAILAPYGTGEFSVPYRIVFWVGLCFAGGFGAGLSDLVLQKLGHSVGTWKRAFLQSMGGTIIVTIMMVGLSLMLSGPVSLKQVLTIIFYVWVISISISVIGALTDRKQFEQGDTDTRSLLFDRLPMHLKSADIYALAAE